MHSAGPHATLDRYIQEAGGELDRLRVRLLHAGPAPR